jgi:hypothetical protein
LQRRRFELSSASPWKQKIQAVMKGALLLVAAAAGLALASGVTLAA